MAGTAKIELVVLFQEVPKTEQQFLYGLTDVQTHQFRDQGFDQIHGVTDKAFACRINDGVLVLKIFIQRTHANTGFFRDLPGSDSTGAVAGNGDQGGLDNGIHGGLGALLFGFASHLIIRVESERAFALLLHQLL